MKNIKILSIFLILIMVFSSFAFTVSAETIDYNSVFGIEIGGVNKFFDLYGQRGINWNNYMIIYEANNANNHFEIVEGYVAYDEQLLINKQGNLVLGTDSIIVAAGCVYDTIPSEELYTIGGTGVLTFHEKLEGMSMSTFVTIANQIGPYPHRDKWSISRYGVLSDVVKLDGGPIQRTKLFSLIFLTKDSVIDFEYTYEVIENTCEHTYMFTNDKVITKATCVSSGLMERTCLNCTEVVQVTLPPNVANGHSWIIDDSLDATCTSTGYVSKHCDLCEETSWELLDYLEHDYISATCTESAKCKICGITGASALGHDFKWNKCQRDGCDVKRVDVGGTASDGWNAVTGAVSDGWNWLVGGGKEVAKEIEKAAKDAGEKIEEALIPGEDNKILGIEIPEIDIGGITNAVSYGINAILALVGAAVLFIVIYYVSKMVANFASALKNNPKRRRRRKRK